MFLYDLANLLPILIVILVSFKFGYIPMWLSFFMGIFAFTPFFLNYVLFAPGYMPDQWQYYYFVQNIRSFEFNELAESVPVEVAGWIYSFIPLPYVETIQSLGFFNRLITTLRVFCERESLSIFFLRSEYNSSNSGNFFLSINFTICQPNSV